MSAQPGGTGRERPIIFGAPMIRALLDGRKTQTRRVLKPQPDTSSISAPFHPEPRGGGRWVFMARADLPGYSFATHDFRLRFEIGDRLWVREAHYLTDDGDYERAVYAVDAAEVEKHLAYFAAQRGFPDALVKHHTRLRSPIHMPRWASRITLTVSDVRVERLQAISEEDAIAEGVELPGAERDDHDWSICPKCGGTGLHGALGDHLGYMEVDCYECDTARKRFRHLWEHINGPGSWQADPWISAITFRCALRNIDAPEGRGR